MKFEEFNFSLNTLYTDTMESKSTISPKEAILHERIYRVVMVETQKTMEEWDRICYEREMDFMLNSQIRALFDVNLMLFLAFFVLFIHSSDSMACTQFIYFGWNCSTFGGEKLLWNVERERIKKTNVFGHK